MFVGEVIDRKLAFELFNNTVFLILMCNMLGISMIIKVIIYIGACARLCFFLSLDAIVSWLLYCTINY